MWLGLKRRQIVAFLGVLVAIGAIFAIYLTTRTPTPKRDPKDQVVLARVGVTTVTQYDLDFAIEEGFVKRSRPLVEGESRKQMLESLIQARAIALLREAELTDGEKLELEKQVARHREELLVKQYLIKHGNLRPMEVKELRAYYDAHPEEFGGHPQRAYELVAAERQLAGKDRDDVIRELGKAAAQPDWFEWTKRLRDAGLPVFHRRGDLAAGMMQAQLATVAEKLKPGEASSVAMIDGRPHVVRLVAETQGTVKPFESVAAEIRERLAPRVLSEAAKRAADEAMKKIEIERY